MAVQNSDIQFLYTTPLYSGVSVYNASFSAGGYPSSTSVVFSRLFNSRFSNALTQYRCIAVQNTNMSSTCYAPQFFFRSGSLNPSTTVKMAVEVPTSGSWAGTVSAGSLMSIGDNTFPSPSVFADNYFLNCRVTITSGVNLGLVRQIISYDAGTKSFSLSSSLAVPCAFGDSYTIDAGPSQQPMSSIVSPNVALPTFSGFSTPIGPQYGIGINIGSRYHGTDLLPNDTVYVWLKRTLTKNAPGFSNDQVTISMRWNTV